MKLNSEQVIPYLREIAKIEDKSYWGEVLKGEIAVSIHLAVVVEPYLTRILLGEKTIESRYSKNSIAPYKQVKKGDIVLLKKSGGDIHAVFEAGEVQYYTISKEEDLYKIREEYNSKLKVDDSFWSQKKDCKYVTLVEICNIWIIPSFGINKKSRSAWVRYGQREEGKQLGLHFYPNIICFVGPIASGKTYISKKVASINNYSYISTSDYLRNKLAEKCIESPTRSQLQEMGKQEIESGWNNFVNNFLVYAELQNKEECIVIDGIRHIEFIKEIKYLINPQKCIVIYIDTPIEIIKSRLQARGENVIDYEHIAEGKQALLREFADYISDGSIDGIDEYLKVKL